MKPLNDVVVGLSDIVGHNDYYGTEEIENISYQIKTIGELLNEKIEMLTDEKDKVNFIIDNMNQGVIVINNNEKVMLINDYASRLFNYQKDEIIDKHYIYLIRDLNFQGVIRETIEKNNVTSFDVAIDDSIYLVNVSSVTSKWNVPPDTHFGVLIIMVDVTDLRNIEKMKREFFANASHELKSPLTTILGYQELVAEGMISDQTEIIDAARRTVKEASRMNNIIMEMLELSRLESKETFEISNVNLKDVVTDAIDSFKQQIEDRGINVRLDLKDLRIPINTNHANQLIRNLVDNAIKYNKDHGMITITLQEKENHKMFIIEDNGIGIAPEFQKRVFERFFRVDKARSKEMGGTGLGLSIVKHICILSNASISLSSELNKGTRIVVKF
jgi:two-component system phosphate regulon sensor histidine kinase PhoR